jgi:hypothetical protein
MLRPLSPHRVTGIHWTGSWLRTEVIQDFLCKRNISNALSGKWLSPFSLNPPCWLSYCTYVKELGLRRSLSIGCLCSVFSKMSDSRIRMFIISYSCPPFLNWSNRPELKSNSYLIFR